MDVIGSSLKAPSSSSSRTLNSVGSPEQQIEQIRHLSIHIAPQLLLILFLLATAVAFIRRTRSTDQPPSLSDPIPYLFNTLQFLRNNDKFMARAKKILETTSLAKFYQGTNLVYLVTGPKNVQAIFGRSHIIDNSGFMLQSTLPTWYKLSKNDVKRFAADKSGRGRNPLPGTENTPENERYWHGYEYIHNEYLAKTQYVNPLIEHYESQLSESLGRTSTKEWTTLSVMNFCKQEVTRCAIHTLIGPKVFEISPDFIDQLWSFDDVLFSIVMGPPKWLYPRPHRVHERYLASIRRYLDSAWEHFDWDGPAAEARWEPHFGAQMSREVVKWFKDKGFNERDTGAGAIGILAWAENSNVIPTTMWMIMEIIKDSSLLQAVKEEVSTAYVTDPQTKSQTLDVQKVANLPLLTSIYTETLRLHMSFNVMRNVQQSFQMDGYTIPKGSMIQAPQTIAHYDETIWGVDEHPALEFWAERHVKSVEEKDDAGNMTYKRSFAMAGRSGSYFPYGGGNLICPGRHFAKQEIMVTISLLVSKLDVEFVEWTKLDNTPSNRPARNDPRYSGGGATPPDRDMKIRIKRVA